MLKFIDFLNEREGQPFYNFVAKFSNLRPLNNIRWVYFGIQPMLGTNLDRDNLSTMAKTPTPNVSVIWSFQFPLHYISTYLLCKS